MTISSAGPMRLGQLLFVTYQFCMAYWKPIIVAAVILGTIGATIHQGVEMNATKHFGAMMQTMGMDMQRYGELMQRMQNGDESAKMELDAIMNRDDDPLDIMGKSGKEELFYMQMGAWSKPMFIGVLLGFLLSLVSSAYFLVLALHAQQDPMQIARKVPHLLLPLLGVWVWSFLRSFAWIPFIGVIIAIVIGPRFALASVILVQEKKGVMASVSDSYNRTKGYWGKIVGNAIVMCLCIIGASIVAGIIASILGMISPFITTWVLAVWKYVGAAFATVFIVQLSLTIMANPMIYGATKPASTRPRNS